MRMFTQFQQLGVTILVATHERAVVESLPFRRLVIEKGSLISDGWEQTTLNRWLSDHTQAVSDAWKRTLDRFTQFIVLVCLLGILLAIPGWLAQIWIGMASLVPEDAVRSEAIVFLKQDLDVEARIDLERSLSEMPSADEIVFVPRSAALEQLSSQDGLEPIADLKTNNPLPDALRLKFIIQGAEADENQIIENLMSDERVLSLRYYPSTRIQYACLLRCWVCWVLAYLH